MFENGKSYSELKQTCLDLTSLDIKLNSLKDGSTAQGDFVYILFIADNTKAEVFLPKKDKGIVLNKTNEGNWSNQNYKLISWKGFALLKDGKPIFGGQ